jgi:homospermidine synthase
VTIVVGTKTDLAFGRKVSFEEARELSASINATYLEISSVINTNVKYLFEIALT